MKATVKERQDVRIGNRVVTVTHPEKTLWPEMGLQKQDYLRYLDRVWPRMAPFLQNRPLTVVRYPDGAEGESFYQKNRPDYAPDFVRTVRQRDVNAILCNEKATFIWLGNQGAFEFHVPYQPYDHEKPSEIVFDLDPPSRDAFPQAVDAACRMKAVLDGLHMVSFVKLSGNKGLQVYLPLPDETFSYEDTRRFTRFIAEYLVEKDPDRFTVERLKKNRGDRLYVDYLQHAEGKTIIAPYSVRGNPGALAAAPLFWEEVNDRLRPESFSLKTVIERLEQQVDPFADFEKAKQVQPFRPVLSWLASKGR